MPTRSPGCLNCRKRKIRCDETRPHCKRCAVHGVPCLGYRLEKAGGLEFKDQTNITARRAEKTYKAKALQENGSSSSSGSSSAGSPYTSSNGASTPAASTSTTSMELVPLPIDEGFTNTELNLILSPAYLSSPELERTALYSEFITTYLPKTTTTAQDGHYSFLQTLALKRSTQPALQESFDALGLVQLGSLHKDKVLLKQAVARYATALSSLGRSIAKGYHAHDDDILAAVTVMAVCEFYQEIADVGGGWSKHVQGSNELVAARGPESLKSELSLLLYSNMHHGSFVHALIERKASFMAAPEWRAVAFQVPRAALDPSTLFYDIGIQVPGLLERHDNLDLKSYTALADVDALLADSAEVEAELRAWFTGWQALHIEGSRRTTIYTILPISSFPTFSQLCPDRTFTHAYAFPDFLIAYLHSLYWLTIYELRSNTQSLHKRRHTLDNDWYPSDAEVVPEEELLGYVLDLCQCIPFFVEPVSSSTGSIGIFLPLRCVAYYFKRQGLWRFMKWVGSVKDSVFVKGLVPPALKEDGAVQLPLQPGRGSWHLV